MKHKKRLIDAIKFEKQVTNHGADNLFKEDVIAMLARQSTVDAKEVVHGEWVVCGDGEYVPFKCSACGKTTSWYHKQTANFCPNCGAKMDW
ncbi:MAG: hypothetical protein IKB09_09645 [Oscillospiraceae bacterium]|nr:hypothetical protein [Oscillospiraceae bacterium]MBR6595181.1 hypothetical protein [Oscillospiraceae bacterium]